MSTLPIWPPLFFAATAAAAAPAVVRRWIVVENDVHREVTERVFRDLVASCKRIEVVRNPHEDVITHVCYR